MTKGKGEDILDEGGAVQLPSVDHELLGVVDLKGMCHVWTAKKETGEVENTGIGGCLGEGLLYEKTVDGMGRRDSGMSLRLLRCSMVLRLRRCDMLPRLRRCGMFLRLRK